MSPAYVQGLKLSAPLVLPLPPQKKEAPVRCYPPIRWKVKKHCLLEVEDVQFLSGLSTASFLTGPDRQVHLKTASVYFPNQTYQYILLKETHTKQDHGCKMPNYI